MVGAGQSLIPLNFPGSIEICHSSIIIPRYSTFGLLNSHFLGFRNKSFSCNQTRNLLVFSVKVVSSGVKRKISSIYMMTMASLIILLKMVSIIDWKVAGKLHIPKNSSNNPLLVLKAAFHWSPS